MNIDSRLGGLGDHLSHGHLVPGLYGGDRPAVGTHGQGDDHLLGRLLQGMMGLRRVLSL